MNILFLLTNQMASKYTKSYLDRQTKCYHKNHANYQDVYLIILKNP